VAVVGRRVIGISGWGRRGLSRRMREGVGGGCLSKGAYIPTYIVAMGVVIE
jgi:hypothetical protein